MDFIDPRNLPDDKKVTLRDVIRGIFLLTAYPSEIASITPTYKVVIAETGADLPRDQQRLALRDSVRIYVRTWVYPNVVRAFGVNPDTDVCELLTALDDEVGALAFELEALTCPSSGRWEPIRHLVRLTQIEMRLASLFNIARTQDGHAWEAIPHDSHPLIETIRPAMARFYDAMRQLEHEQVKARAAGGGAHA